MGQGEQIVYKIAQIFFCRVKSLSVPLRALRMEEGKQDANERDVRVDAPFENYNLREFQCY
jgi:hypothetical protein